MTDNPYLPEGHEEYPDAPLDPRRHAHRYFEVGGHGEAMARFETALRAAGAPGDSILDALCERGRLVAVEGPQRSGKSTLVRRCAQFLVAEAQSGAVPFQVHTVDATAPPGLAGAGRDETARAVRDVVLARAEGFLESERIDRAASKESPGATYAVLSGALGPRRILQVLTPPVTPEAGADNADRYQEWAAPGVIFYLEHTPGGHSRPLITRAPRLDTEAMLMLRLRDLTEDEVRTVVKRVEDEASHLPPVDPAAVERLHDHYQPGARGLGAFVGLLSTVYLRRSAPAPLYQLPYVGFEELQYIRSRELPREQP